MTRPRADIVARVRNRLVMVSGVAEFGGSAEGPICLVNQKCKYGESMRSESIENKDRMLPETLRLEDYGLDHDARDPQPVALRLGPRFHPWQLARTGAGSWQECRRHANNVRRIRAVGKPAAVEATVLDTDAENGSILPTAGETDLFGERASA